MISSTNARRRMRRVPTQARIAPLASFQKRAEQRQGRNSRGCCERDLLGDHASPGMASEVKAIDAFRIGDGDHVGSHIVDRELPVVECAASDAAIIDADNGVPVAERIYLRRPASTDHAHTLDQMTAGPDPVRAYGAEDHRARVWAPVQCISWIRSPWYDPRSAWRQRWNQPSCRVVRQASEDRR